MLIARNITKNYGSLQVLRAKYPEDHAQPIRFADKSGVVLFDRPTQPCFRR